MLVSANIFQPLIDVFQSVIEFFHNSMGIGWGWSIVLLTVCVRLVLVPLTIKQFQGMRAMQLHAPEMKAIQQKYKEDKQRQQQEMMKFYRENNVNPFASCLPLVLQFPVFISLYYMLRKNLRTDICPRVQAKFQAKYAASYATAHHISSTSATALHAAASQTTACTTYGPVKGSGFLFIHDITNTATGLTLVVLIILYVGTQVLSTMLMAQPTMDKSQQRMMMLLPVMFVLFIIRFPAGLIMYWITTNAWTMIQQLAIRRLIGPPPPVAGSDGNQSSGGGLFGGLGSRLRPAPAGAAAAGGVSRGGGASGGGTSGAGTSNRRGTGSRGAGSGGSGSGSTGAKGSADGASAAGKSSGGTPSRPPPPRRKKKRSGRRR